MEYKWWFTLPQLLVLKDGDERGASISCNAIFGHHLTKESACATHDKRTQWKQRENPPHFTPFLFCLGRLHFWRGTLLFQEKIFSFFFKKKKFSRARSWATAGDNAMPVLISKFQMNHSLCLAGYAWKPCELLKCCVEHNSCSLFLYIF